MTDFASSHIRRIDDAHARIGEVERRVGSLEREGAVVAEQIKTVAKGVDEIKTGIGRLAWLFIAGFVTAAVAFIIKGGLA